MDQDDKLIVPIARFGMQGYGIIVKLMGEIYRNGYFYQWGEREQYVFASRINVDINTISEVINECIKWGFFHQELYERHNILTSKGFQKRYIEAAKRRKEINMSQDYILIDAAEMSERFKITLIINNADGNKVNVYINKSKNDETSTESTQSKVKESKVNKKESNNKPKRPPSRQQKAYAEDSSPYRMALYLHSKIMEYAETLGVVHLVRDAKLQSWADDCRKLLENDKRDKEEIKQVIDWTTSNKFWRKNILSAGKLREKYKDLCINMVEELNQGGGAGVAEKGGSRKGHDSVHGRSSSQSGALQVPDDELDKLQRQSLQMLEVSGHGHH